MRWQATGFGQLEDGLRQASDWYLWGPHVSETAGPRYSTKRQAPASTI